MKCRISIEQVCARLRRQAKFGASLFNQNLTFQLRFLGCIPFKDDLDGVHYIYIIYHKFIFSTFLS